METKTEKYNVQITCGNNNTDCGVIYTGRVTLRGARVIGKRLVRENLPKGDYGNHYKIHIPSPAGDFVEIEKNYTDR